MPVYVGFDRDWNARHIFRQLGYIRSTMETIKQRIAPHLWYDKEAEEAAKFYASIFPDSTVTNVGTLPSGDTDVVSFELWGQKFMAISAGPLFKFNPSVSFMVNFDPLFFDPFPSREKDAREKIDEVWEKLSDGGTVLMPIGHTRLASGMAGFRINMAYRGS